MKYCKDCKYYMNVDNCMRNELAIEDLVQGLMATDPKWNREDEERCGKDAKFFEEIPAPQRWFAAWR